MYLKLLKISDVDGVKRNIIFKRGLNLIIDNTDEKNLKSTGNNVGKTTVLKLIDFCLGAKSKIIYSDTENTKDEDAFVKAYLVDKEVVIKLVLSEDLDDSTSKEIVIERNFLSRKSIIRNINGEKFKTEKEFTNKLNELLFPKNDTNKPGFRQIISHNIRYKDRNINNTLKTVNNFTTDAEYETLYLFLLGLKFEQGAKKQELLDKLKREKDFKKRLEISNTKNAYEVLLSSIDSDINNLNINKENMNFNKNFDEDLSNLNKIKYSINKLSSKISTYKIRRDLIIDAKKELDSNHSDIDLVQLRLVYEQANCFIKGLQKKFDDLVEFHNKMIMEKSKYIALELPSINETIENYEKELQILLKEENCIATVISKSDSFEEFESVIKELNNKHQQKGEYENILNQISEVEKNIKKFEEELKYIADDIFSEKFENKLKEKIKNFNEYFSDISNELYGEKYLLKHEKGINKNGQKLYKFSSFNANISSGKKQGEILCFDLAYNRFAENNNISHLNFILNDKKELMHDNQLIKLSDYIKNENVQVVMSILRDKLPDELNIDNYCIIELMQDDKLFRIE